MARRPTLVSDGIFYGAMSFILAAVFAVGIGFAHTELAGNSLVGGFMIAGIVAVIAGWIIARFAAGGDLPPPNSVKINPPPAPTVPRSRAAERRAAAATPTLPDRLPTAHEAGVAVGAAASSAANAVREATSEVREKAAETISPAEEPAARSEASVEEPAARSEASVEEPVAAPAAGAEAGRKPDTLAAPREGGGDDLLAIKGIGPKLMGELNEMGIYHYDQIAGWSEAEVAWVDSHVDGVNGRASRDDWVGQAKKLVADADTGQH
jgi:predicted flap endonuclease-1-like 5' DNA nuclease